MGDDLCGPEPPQQLHLLGEPRAAVGKVLAERLVLDRVPADADTEAEVAVRQQVDLGGLFRDEGGLALREDDDAADELERRDRGQVAIEHEGLVEGRLHVVAAGESLMDTPVGPDEVVVAEDVRKTKIADRFGVLAYARAVSANLGLGKDDANAHRLLLARRFGRALGASGAGVD